MRDVTTEDNGRYTEIYIEGVPDGSIALDEETNELIVDGEARLREYNGAVIDLPDERRTFEQE
jgi:hypothetical protein